MWPDHSPLSTQLKVVAESTHWPSEADARPKQAERNGQREVRDDGCGRVVEAARPGVAVMRLIEIRRRRQQRAAVGDRRRPPLAQGRAEPRSATAAAPHWPRDGK